MPETAPSGTAAVAAKLLSRRAVLTSWLPLCAAVSGAGATGVAGCTVRPKHDAPPDGPPSHGGTLRIADTTSVPDAYFVGSSFGFQLATWMQFAWPLFVASPTRFELVNGLAAAYRPAADGLAHTIAIRPGITFHDGSPIDADAVAENIRATVFADHPLRDKGSYDQAATGFGVPSIVKRVEVADRATVRIVLTRPQLDIRDPLWQFPIINPRILADTNYGTDPAALAEAGSGPFRLVRFQPGSFVEFERYSDFFDPSRLDRVRFDRIGETAQLGLGLRSGEFDVALQLSQSDHDQLAVDPDFQPILASRPNKNVFLWFNPPRKPELTDRRVREAIWLALNREAYRQAFFARGTAHPSALPGLVAGTEAYDAAIPERPYDPERARSLLADASVDGLTLTVTSESATYPLTSTVQLYDAMAQDLAAVGITLDFRISDAGTVAAEWERNDFNLTAFDGPNQVLITRLLLMGSAGGFPEPDPRADPRVKRLVDAATTSLDLAEQNRLLRQLMRLHHEELMMAIPLAMVATSAIARKEVRGFRISPVANDPQHLAWIAK